MDDDNTTFFFPAKNDRIILLRLSVQTEKLGWFKSSTTRIYVRYDDDTYCMILES